MSYRGGWPESDRSGISHDHPLRELPALNLEASSILAGLFDSAGLDIRDYRLASIQRRVPALLRRLRVPALSAAGPVLKRSIELRWAALECLLLGVTEFFRDPAVFDFLRRTALPELLTTRAGARLRVLSAGAGDGRELYSVAMVLAEAGALERCELLGIDCRPDAIAQARAAVFTPEAVTTLEPTLRTSCFVQSKSEVRLRPEIASAARFEVRNLLRREADAPWDLILCRNVIMYFEPSAAERAWRQLEAQLSRGGLLVTGKAEQPPACLALTRLAPCVYWKTAPTCSQEE